MVTINDLYRQLFGRSGTTKGTDISMSEHGRLGGISTAQGYKHIDIVNYATKITEDGDVTYVAFAKPGTAQDSALWRAMKIDSSSGTVITWADGDSEFDNVASDLTALDYS